MENKEITRGFTIAEILVTITIIGILAILILPTIISNYQKKVTISKIQKNIAALEQAIRMSEVENGETAMWTLPNESFAGNTKFFAEKYFFPFIKTTRTAIPASNECWENTKNIAGNSLNNNFIAGTNNVSAACATLINGSNIYLWAKNPLDNYSPHAQIWIDINGKKGPNILGKDVFGFTINFEKGKMFPSGYGLTREELTSTDSESGCNKNNNAPNAGQHCSGLIINDGWTIQKDYPW